MAKHKKKRKKTIPIYEVKDVEITSISLVKNPDFGVYFLVHNGKA